MAKLAGRFVDVYYAGYELTGHMNSVSIDLEFSELDGTAFRDGSMNSVPGMPKAAVEVSALMDPATNKSHATLSGQVGSYTSKELLVLVGQNTNPTVGDPAFLMSAKNFKYNVPVAVDGAIVANSSLSTDGVQSIWGTCLVNATVTTTTNGTSVDNGYATGRGTGQAFLQVVTAMATDTAAIKVQDSNDDVTFADLTTFALDGSAVGSERDEISVNTPNTNNGFENGTTGWSAGGTDTDAIAQSDTRAVKGHYSLRLTSGTDTAHTNYAESPKITGIVQNDIVAIDLWVYVPAAWPDDFKIYVIEYNGADAEQARTQVGSSITTTGAWVRFRDEFKCTNAAVAKAALAIGEPTAQNFSGGAVTAFIDEAYIVEANIDRYVRYQTTHNAGGEDLKLAVALHRGDDE
jgi:hypothetical protein